MIKVKDGYAKLIGTTASGSASRVLLSNGGDHVLGNANGNIPLNNGTVSTNLNADMLDGLHIHTGRNNEANKVVRTDASGYILAGWINTTSGDMGTTAATRIYCSNDGYIRYKTPANFFSVLTNSSNLLSITVGDQNRKVTVAYATTAGSATNADTVDSLHSYAFKKTWEAHAGKTYIGWVTIAKWTMSAASHFSPKPFMLSIHRAYNSPASESYTFAITFGWDTAHITQVSGNAKNRIIEKLRIAKCSDNLTYRLEMYVNTGYTTYDNVCTCVAYGYYDSNFSATTVCELTANVASTLAEVTTASNYIVGNLSGTATNATNVYVNLHTGNNIEYPLVWSNQNNTNSALSNQLYKSYSHLTYNPSAHRISTGQYIANNSSGPHYTANSTAGNWAYIRLNNSSTYWDIATRSDSGSGGLWLARLKGADNGIFVSTGNSVGISTSSPSDKFHVNGGQIRSTHSSRYLRIGPQNSSHAHYETDADISHWFNKRVEVNGHVNPYSNNSFTSGTSDKRWSNVYSVLGNFTGNVTLYSASGDSPHLYFLRGTTTDGTYDWDMFVTGGSLTLRQNNSGTWNTALTAADNYMSTGWRFNVGKELSVRDQRFNYGLAYYNTNTSTVTGTIVITLPNGWTNAMNTYEIDIYEYIAYDEDADNVLHSKLIIDGYNYSGSSAWINYGYTQIGSYNKGVRLGYNGSKCVIMLGTTTTKWTYPQVHLSRVITGYGNQTAWSTGYSISVITSESGYSAIVTAYRLRQRFADVVANNFRGDLKGTADSANKLKVTSCGSTTNSKLWDTIKVGTNPLTVNFYDVYNDGGPTTYGNILEIVGITSHWQPQLWFDSYKTGSIRHRNKSYNDNTWGSWLTLLDSNNYTAYTVTKTGSGASGTWGINITGNATTATSATKSNSSDWLNGNSKLEYGASGLNYFNLNGTAKNDKSNCTPEAGYYHILRMNHANAGGYLADIAVPLNNVNGIYWRQIRNGNFHGWYKLIDDNNYSSILDSRYYTETEVNNKLAGYLPLAGGTMSSGTAQIQRAGSSVSWYLGRTNAMIRINSYSGYNAIASMKTTNGDWSLGVHSNNVLYFTYITDTNFNAGTNTVTALVSINASGNLYATHFYENSDEQLKTNIQEILNSDKMPIIKEFDWKEDNSHSYGLIAQELEELGYSELVSTKDDGYKTVNYSAALSLIVGKLQVKIKELEKEIENLKNKN